MVQVGQQVISLMARQQRQVGLTRLILLKRAYLILLT